MTLTIALVIGLLAGAHCATWGMYKDAPHEGFTVRKYFRSILVGAATALLLVSFFAFDLRHPGAMLVLFGLTYVTERGIVEVWKTFVREEDQSKYFIPMGFHVGGRVVTSRGKRLAVGAAYVAAVTLILVGVAAIDRHPPALPRMALVLLVGSIGGWISAFGGAWKDAPIEGFELLKFFRSPATTMFFAALLSTFTDSYLFIALASLGYERAAIETYKTFFFPNKPRGKFAGKPVTHPEMLTQRQRFVPLYAAIWLAILVTGVAAFRDAGAPVTSLRRAPVSVLDSSPRVITWHTR